MAVAAQGLVLQYGSYTALRDVTVDVPSGQYVVVIGENGAGKSTLLKCLAGWLRPTAGTVTIEGLSPATQERAIRGIVKFVPDTPQFYPEMTAWEHLEIVARAHRAGPGWRTEAETLLEAFALDRHRGAFPGSFSRGMQYKLAVAMSLLAAPRVLLLDEPFGPLDPYSQSYLARRFTDLSRDGVTVMASTHLLPEDSPPERVLVLDQGAAARDVAVSTWWDPGTPLATLPSRLLQEVLSSRRGSAIADE